MTEKLLRAFFGHSDEGDTFVVSLVDHQPRGVLEITLRTGETWRTDIGLDEIALFQCADDRLLDTYLDEMFLNAKAGRVH
jgi:hypothetical protein